MNPSVPSHSKINQQGRWLTLLLPLTLVGLLILAVHHVSARPTVDWGGELPGDTTLDPADNPHVVNRDLIVPLGVTLTVKPSVELRFAPGAALIVRGRLLAEGTPTHTIRFTRRDDGTYWSLIVFDDSSADNRIAHAVIEYMHGLAAQYSSLHLLHSEIHDIGGDAVLAIGGAAVIQGNHVYNVDCGAHGCEGIQVRETPPSSPALVVDNHVHHVNDDCLDVNDSSVIVERNRMHHCDDKGISLGSIGKLVPGGTQPTSATLVNNLVYSSAIGVAVKDSAFARLVHNTIAGNKTGLALYEAPDHPGYGGGHATVINTILWGNDRSIKLDALSTLTVSYSDVAGETTWPGEGNLNVAPAFQAADDYHLSTESPLIDAGHDAGVAIDLDGLPRPVGSAPDAGAYEVQSLLYLWARPGDERIYLAWQVAGNHPAWASFAISFTASPQGSLINPSTLITGLPTTTRAYTLTGLVNYVWHTVTVEARDADQSLMERSNPVVVRPTDHYVYLPIILRSHP